MNERLKLFAYLSSAITLTVVHDPRWLAIGAIPLLLLSWRHSPRLLRRLLFTLGPFLAAVNIGFALLFFLGDPLSSNTVILINLRVFLLTYLSLFAIARINLFVALSFSRSLVFLLVLAYSQALSFRRIAEDFRLAFLSRTIARPGARVVFRQRAALARHLVEKALRESAKISLAMKARGFFDYSR